MFLPRKGLTMKKTINKQKGFTLIEIIFVLIIVGIMLAVGGLGLVHVVKGMIFTKMNAATTQKGQIAMTKLVREFSNISGVTASGTQSITFKSIKYGVEGTRKVEFSGNTITFSEGTSVDILMDQVSAFNLLYYNYNNIVHPGTWQDSSRVIEIRLKLTGADGVESEFIERVRPRNIERR